jgi:hypothetical protein
MHSTSNLEDGYIGSGRRLWLSINKHGKENHTKEILEFLDDRKDLKDREQQLVNEDILKDSMCMNLKPGGEGGLCSEAHRKKFQSGGASPGGKAIGKKNILKFCHTEEAIQKNRDIKFQKTGSFNSWKGKNHSQETKSKMRNSHKNKHTGSLNSQFGTQWIHHAELMLNKKIKKEEPIPIGWTKGRKLS